MIQLTHEVFYKIFEAQAEKAPNHPAVYWLEKNLLRSLTYKQINDRANQLARFLKAQFNPENRLVSVCMSEHPNYIISLLGIWKAGYIYIPINPNVELECIYKQIKDTGCTVVLLNDFSKNKPSPLNEVQSLIIDDEYISAKLDNFSNQNLEDTVSIDADAYLMRSSGTTGPAKLIMCPFRGLPLRANGILAHIEIQPKETILNFSPFDFDASLMDIMIAFGSGASLYLVPAFIKKNVATLFTNHLRELKHKGLNLSYAALIPSVVSKLVDYCPFKYIITMGDECRWQDVKLLIENGVIVFDGYGPTEAIIAATIRRLVSDRQGLINVNDPSHVLPGVTLYIDSDKGIIPITDAAKNSGMMGELLIAGNDLARYYNNDTLNKQNFITHENKTLYRTADCVKVMDDGELWYLYRLDQAVKINGRLIDTKKFKKRLAENDFITEVAIVKKGQTLLSYLVMEQSPSIHTIIDMYAIFESWQVCIFRIKEMPRKKAKGSIDYGSLPSLKDKELLLPGEKSHTQDPLEIAVRKIIISLCIPESILMSTVDPAIDKGSSSSFVTQMGVPEPDKYDIPLSRVGFDSIQFPELIEQLWRLVTTDKTIQPPFDFKRGIIASNNSFEIATIIKRYKHNMLQNVYRENLPAIFFMVSKPDKEYEALCKVLHATGFYLILVTEVSLTAGEHAADILRNIKTVQAKAPYHLVYEETNQSIIDYLTQHMPGKFIVTKSMIMPPSPEDIYLLQQQTSITHLYAQKVIHALQKNLKKYIKVQLTSTVDNNETENISAYVKKFLLDNAKTFFVFGSVGSGKSSLAIRLVDMMLNEKDDIITFYIDLRGKNSNNIFKDFLEQQGLTSVSINNIFSRKVIFVCDNYHLLARDDYLNLVSQVPEGTKLIIFSHFPRDIFRFKRTWGNNLPTYFLKDQKTYSTFHVPNCMSQELLSNTSLKADEDMAVWLTINICRRISSYFFEENQIRIDMIGFQIFVNRYLEFTKLHDVTNPKQNTWGHTNNQEVAQIQLALKASPFFNYLLYFFVIDNLNIARLPDFLVHFCSIEPKALRKNLLMHLSDAELVYLANITGKKALTASPYSLFKSPDQHLAKKGVNLEYVSLLKNIEILNQDGTMPPIFMLYPLAGDIPNGYRNIAAELGNNFPVIIFKYEYSTKTLSQLALQFSQQIYQLFPRGPYILLGWSFGGILAFLTGKELERSKRDVRLVYIVDTPSPESVDTISMPEKARYIAMALATEEFMYPIPEKYQKKYKMLLQQTPVKNATHVWRVAKDILSELITAHSLNLGTLLNAIEVCEVNLAQNYSLLEQVNSLRTDKLRSQLICAVADTPTEGVGNGVENFKWEQYASHAKKILFSGTHFSVLLQDNKLLKHIKTSVYSCFAYKVYETSLEEHLQHAYANILARFVIKNRNQQHIRLENDETKDSENIIDVIPSHSEDVVNLILCLGEAGAGKTLLARQSFYSLAKRYIMQHDNLQFLPVFLDTSTLTIDDFFKSINLSKEEIAMIRTQKKIIVFVDGLDEYREYLPFNDYCITALFLFSRSATIMGTWAQGTLGNQIKQIKYQTVHLLGFDFKQADQFLKENGQVNTDSVSLMKHYPKIFSDGEINSSTRLNPLILSFLCIVLAENSMHIDLSSGAALYTRIFSHLIAKGISKACNNRGLPIPEEEVENSLFFYAQELALQLENHQFVVHTDPYFCSEEPITAFLRSMCPLEIRNNYIRFTHISFQHYLIARKMCQEYISEHDTTLLKKFMDTDSVYILDFLFDMLIQDENEKLSNLNHSIDSTWITNMGSLVVKIRRGASQVLTIMEAEHNIKMITQNTESSIYYAILLYEAGRSLEALNVGRECLVAKDITPDRQYLLLCNLGTFCVANKKFNEAYNYFDRALQVQMLLGEKDPDIGYLYNAFADICYDPNNPDSPKNKNIETAYRLLNQSIEEEKNYPKKLKTLRFVGWAHFSLAKLAVMEKDIEKAKYHKEQFIRCISTQFGNVCIWPKPYIACIKGFNRKLELLAAEAPILRPTFV